MTDISVPLWRIQSNNGIQCCSLTFHLENKTTIKFTQLYLIGDSTKNSAYHLLVENKATVWITLLYLIEMVDNMTNI